MQGVSRASSGRMKAASELAWPGSGPSSQRGLVASEPPRPGGAASNTVSSEAGAYRAYWSRRDVSATPSRLWLDGAAMTRRYFRSATETLIGNGEVYIEFDGEWATRQVDVIDERWFRSDRRDYHPEIGVALTDQPLSMLDPAAEDEITQAKFEHVWEEALRRCR
jgi:hypothetical protein